MSEVIAIFTLDSNDIKIQCTKKEKFEDICQRFANKIGKEKNSYIYLYGGNQLNFELRFYEQVNSFDQINNEMKVLVYKTINDSFTCPKCGKKIKFNREKIDELILSNNNICDNINGTKLIIENMIKNSTINSMNIQLKNINIILNTINEDIKKIMKISKIF